MTPALRKWSLRRSEAGATIYHAMLGIACAALAIAIFFQVYEYVELYTGPVRPYKFTEAGGAPPVVVQPAATPRPSPAPAPVQPAPGAGEAPQPVEEPKTEAPAAAQ